MVILGSRGGLIRCAGMMLVSGLTSAGPPLNIDDPGILEPGEWEVIFAASYFETEPIDVIEFPVLDISYGLTPDTQVSVTIPYVFEGRIGDTERSGLGFLALGYKWRFWSGDSSEWAIAPGISFLMDNDLIPRDSDEDVEIFNLPVLYARIIGDWTVMGQLKWFRESEGLTAWDYGVSASRALSDSTQGMVEVYGVANRSFDQREISLHFGLDRELESGAHLLTSLGTHLARSSGSIEGIDVRIYLGMQWFF
jgi:hypothetical protein